MLLLTRALASIDTAVFFGVWIGIMVGELNQYANFSRTIPKSAQLRYFTIILINTLWSTDYPLVLAYDSRQRLHLMILNVSNAITNEYDGYHSVKIPNDFNMLNENSAVDTAYIDLRHRGLTRCFVNHYYRSYCIWRSGIVDVKPGSWNFINLS